METRKQYELAYRYWRLKQTETRLKDGLDYSADQWDIQRYEEELYTLRSSMLNFRDAFATIPEPILTAAKASFEVSKRHIFSYTYRLDYETPFLERMIFPITRERVPSRERVNLYYAWKKSRSKLTKALVS
jgi:hypothetical protein